MLDVKLIAVDVWAWLVPAVFIVIYLLNHLLTAKAGAAGQRNAQQQRRRAAAGERPLRPGPQQQPQQGGPSQLNAEIEQFLKRANERRMEKARGAEPARAVPAAPAPSEALREQPLDIVPLEPRDFASVSASVEQHLGGHSFQDRAEHMVDDIALADAERARHFKRVFDHRLGKLGDTEIDPNAPTDVKAPPTTRDDPQAAAKAMAGLLANQQNIRQAILLKEILERPVDRW
jgi:hypothetical protein